ncbi:hypothetical protein PIB30_018817 [Stylosanthes scabra]|uniref:Uncharacterized protein n=1 Tax=Stylosanthes scabra TaxID=79078 RepID=A0ABU6S7W8_9FABA|nr:hypothetical protein [Stylosanthes scabra]
MIVPLDLWLIEDLVVSHFMREEKERGTKARKHIERGTFLVVQNKLNLHELNCFLGVAYAEMLLPILIAHDGVEKSMRKAKKNIGSKNGLEKACKSEDFVKKEECGAEKRSYSHRIGANLDPLER